MIFLEKIKVKNNVNLQNMTRDQLAQYIVAHRNTPQGIEARRVFIRRIADKAKSYGIELDQSGIKPKSLHNLALIEKPYFR